MPDETPITNPRIVPDARELLRKSGHLVNVTTEEIAQSMTPFQTLLLDNVTSLREDQKELFRRMDSQDREMSATRTDIGEVKALQRQTNGRVTKNRLDIDELTRIQQLEKTRRVEDETTKQIVSKTLDEASKGRWSFKKPTKTQLYILGGALTFIGCDRLVTLFSWIWGIAKTL